MLNRSIEVNLGGIVESGIVWRLDSQWTLHIEDCYWTIPKVVKQVFVKVCIAFDFVLGLALTPRDMRIFKTQ